MLCVSTKHFAYKISINIFMVTKEPYNLLYMYITYTVCLHTIIKFLEGERTFNNYGLLIVSYILNIYKEDLLVSEIFVMFNHGHEYISCNYVWRLRIPCLTWHGHSMHDLINEVMKLCLLHTLHDYCIEEQLGFLL